MLLSHSVMTRCRSLAAAQPSAADTFRGIQEPFSPPVAASSNSKKFLALQNYRVRCYLMNKICLLLTLLFCTLCCILHIAEARESTATTADPDAVFWNWKNKNNRETGSFTYWIMPLGLYPRSLLLNIRFGPPIDASQESRDDFIDQTPALSFWFHWLFVPWWPIKNIALTEFRNAHTYLDDIFLMLSWGGVALDVIISIIFLSRAFRLLTSQDVDWPQRVTHVLRLCLFSFLFTFPVMTLLGFTFASFNYYILFRITPYFISRLLFHCYIYSYASIYLICNDNIVKPKSD